MLACTLILGVGYATVAKNELSIGGKSTAGDFEVNVGFNGDYTQVGDHTVSFIVDSNDDTSAELSIEGFERVGDYCIVRVEIENFENDIWAYVNNIVVEETSPYYDVTAEFKINSTPYTTDSNDPILGVTQDCDVVVMEIRVSVMKVPVVDVEETFTITFDAVPCEAQA